MKALLAVAALMKLLATDGTVISNDAFARKP